MTDKGQNEPVEGRSDEVRVEELARALAQAINSHPIEQREQLREMVVETVRDEVQVVQAAAADASRRAGSDFNPFAIGLPLFGAAVVMGILFPPVGVVLFLAALFMMVWGVASVMFSRD